MEGKSKSLLRNMYAVYNIISVLEAEEDLHLGEEGNFEVYESYSYVKFYLNCFIGTKVLLKRS